MLDSFYQRAGDQIINNPVDEEIVAILKSTALIEKSLGIIVFNKNKIDVENNPIRDMIRKSFGNLDWRFKEYNAHQDDYSDILVYKDSDYPNINKISQLVNDNKSVA